MKLSETSWISTREAAARLNLPPREVYRLIGAGELAARSAGRDLRLPASAVAAFAARRDPH